MRNRRKLLLLLVVALCCAAFAAYYLRQQRSVDREPPKITMQSEELRLSVSDPAERLLEGVRAQDARDGDVTDSIVVESVRGIVADKRFTVTYAAFDDAGNVAKATRTAFYWDYTAPRFSLSEPLIFRAGVTPDVFEPLSAQDVFDGDLTRQIKATMRTSERRLPEQGEYLVEFRVTNSLGDTSYLTAPVEMASDWGGAARMNLSSYLVYLPKDAAFSPAAYLRDLTAGGQTIPLDTRSGAVVTTDSNVNTAVPGTYRVNYTVTYGQYHARTRLLVVVEE